MNHDLRDKTGATHLRDSVTPNKVISVEFLKKTAYKHPSLKSIILPASLLIKTFTNRDQEQSNNNEQKE